nr:unnamed protein product [Digitaria exilis]
MVFQRSPQVVSKQRLAQFVSGNGLRVGDICLFELKKNEKQLVMKRLSSLHHTTRLESPPLQQSPGDSGFTIGMSMVWRPPKRPPPRPAKEDGFLGRWIDEGSLDDPEARKDSGGLA